MITENELKEIERIFCTITNTNGYIPELVREIRRLQKELSLMAKLNSIKLRPEEQKELPSAVGKRKLKAKIDSLNRENIRLQKENEELKEKRYDSVDTTNWGIIK